MKPNENPNIIYQAVSHIAQCTYEIRTYAQSYTLGVKKLPGLQ